MLLSTSLLRVSKTTIRVLWRLKSPKGLEKNRISIETESLIKCFIVVLMLCFLREIIFFRYYIYPVENLNFSLIQDG